MTAASARRLAGLLGLVLAPFGLGGQVRAQSPSPAWTAYAEQVRQALPGWLSEDGEANRRLAVLFDGLRPDPKAWTPPVALKIWIDPAGQVSGTRFIDPALGSRDGDLAASLTGRSVGLAPPPGLPWPLRVAVRMGPRPEPDSPASP